MTDEALIAQIVSGHSTPFRQLMERHQGRVYGLVYKILQDSGDAEDATQEIFLKCYRSLSSFQQSASFSTWLYRIAVNHCMTLLRKRRDNPSWPDESALSVTESPEHITMRRETMAEIEHAISGMPDDAKAVLALRLHILLPFERIGEILDISPDTAKVRFYRARMMLKDLLSKQGLFPASRKERA